MIIGSPEPLLILLSSLIPGIIIFFLAEEQGRLRSTLNLTGAIVKVALVLWLMTGVYRGATFGGTLPFLPGLDLVLRVDSLSMLLLALSSGLWLVMTIYAIGYLEEEPNRSRFFGFYSLCVSATVGIAMAGNLITLFVFYEMLTVTTYPLVVHNGSREARAAGRTYLIYTVSGGTVLLAAMVWLNALVGPSEFAGAAVTVAQHADGQEAALIAVFALLVAGFGVKAALFPLHGWLPRAMVAPAPVSALLHAVAVVKAGAFGIVRVVYDVYGIALADRLKLTTGLSWLAGFTIVYGSVMALRQDNLKLRLAYSTVSQISYIMLGAALFSAAAGVGALVHLIHQGLMKITLFMCAGNLAHQLGIRNVSEMDGVGRRMPWTMAAFTVGALGMIGLPPFAGFISKWSLGVGAADAGAYWALAILFVSSVLNAAYFLPVLHRAWLLPPSGEWPKTAASRSWEIAPALLIPPVVTAVATLLAGLFAATLVSPLGWIENVVSTEYAL